MALFSSRTFSHFKHSLQKIPVFSEKKPFSLACLNIAQCLGAMNDNMFKLLLIYMLIETRGQEKANAILSAVGTLYVLPFLLFSSAAGVLADRFSKQKLLILMKVAEMLILFFALFAFGQKSMVAGYILLFLLSAHSAMFGPSKYGIIPEIVPHDRVQKANGLITSFTYLAMIFGTFLASFLTSITNRKFVLSVGFCFAMAIVGFICALGIKKTPPQGSKKRVNPLFLHEIYETLRFCSRSRHLLVSISASAFFLFVGAFTQLNIIPYAIQSLHLSDIAGGYLFLATALGIAVGSYIAGRASKRHVELGLSCLAVLCVSIIFIFLSIFSSHLSLVIICLLLLGIFGGLFIVPFDSYTQLTSPQEIRGQVIAASNFLSFFGVLLASFCIFFFGAFLNLSPAMGFAVIGLLSFFIALLITARVSDLSFHFFARYFPSLWRVNTRGLELLETEPDSILILENPHFKNILVLLGIVPQIHLLIAKKPEEKISWFYKLFYSVDYLPDEGNHLAIFDEGKKLLREGLRPCFLIDKLSLSKSELSKVSPIFVEVGETRSHATSISFFKRAH